MQKSAYELERDRRVEENKRKMMELGVAEAAAALEEPKPAVKRQRREKKEPTEPVERRVSSRERKAINYSEMEARGAREARAPVDYTERIQGITLDQDKAEQLRADLEAKRASSKASGKSRGPVDSGKGVRIQGGRVYDSKHGVTCHWCRQKTLEDHVTCTNANCGNGRRMPLSFCAKCLRNRHGEDYEAADASGGWWCPACRGSCGPGCVTCCNCGPCRKRAGLDPTHQVVKLARDAGFGNVHDYLVHLVTGEDKEVIAERKLGHSWGAWLKPGGSDASEQTGGAVGGSGSGGGCDSHRHAEEEEAEGAEQEEEEEEGGSAGAAQRVQAEADAADAEQQTDQRAGAARGRKAASRKRGKAAAAAPPAAAAAGKGKGKGRARGKAAQAAAAAAAAAADDEDEDDKQQQQQQQDKAEPEADAVDGGEAAEEDEEQEAGADEDLPMLSSQDTKLTRKQRIMQSLGLAPVTICA